ncbi:competence protein ComEC [Nitrosospira multiformis]|uniref:Competence protein ComEC n=1 Tax=Nitrosospira multiformis TaxID=1231 RepID=A0A1H8MU96_9PROT|nr:DNA internalization-related competence protein ComEC/Rec2 [Nitrosospira multiformis]SEO20965.1 competence protein ComEC [Nitrosospira multiformis]
MRLCILAFVAGVVLLQQQPVLPALAGAWALFPGMTCGILLLRCRAPVFARIGKMLWVCLFLGAGFFWAAAFAQWRLSDALSPEWEGRDIQVIGVVAELPQSGRNSVRFTLDVEQVLTEGAIVPARLSLSWYNERGSGFTPRPSTPSLNVGERWRLTARLKRPHGTANPHTSDFEQWALERNVRATGYVRKDDENIRLEKVVGRPAYHVERLRQDIRDHFLVALPGRAYAGTLVALAVGDQRAIPHEQWQVFTRTGINHLVSISGLHITMLSGLVFTIAYWLWRRSYHLTLRLPARKAAVIAGLVAALGYTLLAGFAIPAQRTLYMLAAVAVTLWLDRSIAMTTVLVWALLAVVVLDPWAVLSPGFWLSFGAIAVIMLVSVGRVGRPHWLSSWTTVQSAITLGLIPLLLAMFQQISLVSPIANAVAIPLVSLVVVPLTLLATLPPLDFLLIPAHAALDSCMIVMEWLSNAPQAVWSQQAPPFWTVVVGTAGIFWTLLPGRWGWRLGIGSGFPARWLGLVALLPMFLLPLPKPEQGELWLTVLDVGQGLAVLARTEKHTLLYDTGPAFTSEADSGSRTVVPFLRGEGIRHLDAMIVTHADSDHSGGALSVLQAVPVGGLVSSLRDGHPIQQSAFNSHRCRAGQSWEWDGVRFDMLHPMEESYNNLRLKSNALSCVLKITTWHGSVLLPADIEKKSEYQLLKRYGEALSSTVLIAPHHGSKTSSTEEFVRRVNPRWVVFTVGYRNRFGHPKEEVAERYRSVGSRLLRSDTDGAILLRFGGNDLAVERWRVRRMRYWHDSATF